MFKDTGNKPPLGHITDSKCKPDITAAFDKHWQDDVTLWPCVRLAGERASAGKSREEQKKQAVFYLHYLLLARPDLLVAQGLLIDDERVLFLVGIGGVGIRSVSVSWNSSNLMSLVTDMVDHIDPSRRCGHICTSAANSAARNTTTFLSAKSRRANTTSARTTIICRGIPNTNAFPIGYARLFEVLFSLRPSTPTHTLLFSISHRFPRQIGTMSINIAGVCFQESSHGNKKSQTESCCRGKRMRLRPQVEVRTRQVAEIEKDGRGSTTARTGGAVEAERLQKGAEEP